MTASEVLSTIARLGGTVGLIETSEGDRIRVHPADLLAPDLLDALRREKTEVIVLLRQVHDEAVTSVLKTVSNLGSDAPPEDGLSLLDYAGKVLGWHPDWPEARPSNWESLPPYVEPEPVLDVPPWYDHHRGGLSYRWMGFGYCSTCRMRIEAHNEADARESFRQHVEAGHAPAPLNATPVSDWALQRPTWTPAPRKNLNVCGGCRKRFTAKTEQESATLLRQHIENAPCEHYATATPERIIARAWHEQYRAEADRRKAEGIGALKGDHEQREYPGLGVPSGMHRTVIPGSLSDEQFRWRTWAEMKEQERAE